MSGTPVYKLTRDVLECETFVALSATEYSAIVLAKKRLIAALEIEEALDLMIRNFVEYERALFDLSLAALLHQRWSWADFRNDRALVNQRLINYLSSARTYIDQVGHHHLGRFGARKAGIALFDRLLEQLRTSSLEYRVMDALRNYAQHRGMPVGLMAFPGEWLDVQNEATRKLRFTTTVKLDLDRLADDRRVDASLLAELRKTKNISLTHMARRYLEGLGSIHEGVRAYIQPDIDTANTLIITSIERTKEACGGKGVGIVAGKEVDDEWEEKHDLFEDIDKRRQELRFRNGSLKNLQRRYVSSEVTK